MRAFVLPGLVAACALSAACSSDDKGADLEPYAREKLLDPATCNECHQDHYKEWSGSMHAYASEDPVFRAMNARGQEETNGELKDFCVKCHAPMAVAEGATTDGLNLDEVPKKLQGVTCYFCHQVKDVEDSHLSNNPILLANDVTMRGAIKDPVPYRAHKSEYSEHLDSRQLAPSSKMCGTCHDIVVPGHFSGAPQDVLLEQTYAEWQQTVFAIEGKSRQSCGDCHMGAALIPAPGGGSIVAQPIAAPPDSKVTMPTRDVRHEHLFFAIDSAHGDFPPAVAIDGPPQKEIQAQRIKDGLDQTIRVQLCAQNPGGAIAMQVENLLAGHNLPSGASIDRRMWAELHVFEGDREAYATGVMQPQADIAAAYDESVAAGRPFFSMWDKATKADGKTPAHMFWEVANIKRDSIPGLHPGLVPDVANAKAFSVSSQKTGTVRPTRITATVWFEPLGLDMLDDLKRTGHLAEDSIREPTPRYALLPNRAIDPASDTTPITITWKPGADTFSEQGLECVETSPKVNR